MFSTGIGFTVLYYHHVSYYIFNSNDLASGRDLLRNGDFSGPGQKTFMMIFLKKQKVIIIESH